MKSIHDIYQIYHAFVYIAKAGLDVVGEVSFTLLDASVLDTDMLCKIALEIEGGRCEGYIVHLEPEIISGKYKTERRQ